MLVVGNVALRHRGEWKVVSFSKPTKSVGIDIGSHSVKAVQMSKSGGRYRIESAGYAAVDPAQSSADPVQAQADALREALRFMNPGSSLIVGALPGQTAVIRYPRLPDVSEAELQRAIDREAAQNLPYDLSEVNIDWTVLDRGMEGEESVAKVLLVAAKHELIDSRVQVADAAGIEFNILGVDSLALADAAEACDFLRVGETVAMVDIGANSTIIHFIRDSVSNFYRDVNWGARELVQAITKSRHCDASMAEQMLQEAASQQESTGEAPPAPPIEEAWVSPPPMPESEHEAPAQPPAPPSEESLSELEDLAGEPAEQATAKETIELIDLDSDELGSVGNEPVGTNALEPLEDEIGPPPGPPASSLEPLDNEISGTARTMDDEPAPAIGSVHEQEDQPVTELLHLPLSRLVGEIRRSFDYYEQQLYERPVDRIILSGGVAHLPIVAQIIRDELGFDAIEAADPGNSALVLGRDDAIGPLLNRPTQFLTAIGLAARGAAEL